MKRQASLGTCWVLAWVALSGSVTAQVPPNIPFKWWNNPRIVQDLGMSSDQTQKIEAIWVDHRKSLIELRAEHDRRQLELEGIIAKPMVEEATLREKIDQLYRAKAEIEKLTLFLRLKIRDILTPRQQEQSKELLNRFRSEALERRGSEEGKRLPPANPRLRPGRIPPSGTPPPD